MVTVPVRKLGDRVAMETLAANETAGQCSRHCFLPPVAESALETHTDLSRHPSLSLSLFLFTSSNNPLWDKAHYNNRIQTPGLTHKPHPSLSVCVCRRAYTCMWMHVHAHTHSLVISPRGPEAVAKLGSKPCVSKMCLAAGLNLNLRTKTNIYPHTKSVNTYITNEKCILNWIIIINLSVITGSAMVIGLCTKDKSIDCTMQFGRLSILLFSFWYEANTESYTYTLYTLFFFFLILLLLPIYVFYCTCKHQIDEHAKEVSSGSSSIITNPLNKPALKTMSVWEMIRLLPFSFSIPFSVKYTSVTLHDRNRLRENTTVNSKVVLGFYKGIF